ncbi:hypothetical protein [Gordonia zhaorongruii]|uniref:hypothetical protein n=1 Tax=Gordonia zhaorongruii TaxID=2597659 RepID=UPI00104A2E20|nr:hypothetical protein [Gordonia zhaorongruii]
MSSARVRGVAALTLTTGFLLSACGQEAPPEQQARPSSTGRAERLALADCAKPAPSGTRDRSGYGLAYSTGAMQVAVEPEGGREQCVEFPRWGKPDVQVPPDTLLFTFSGGNGEGGQFEFAASALTGARVPPVRGRPRPKERSLDKPIAATVGVAIDGIYYTSRSCALTLTTIDEESAAGRFDCPDAIEQTANPFDPSDDVPHDVPAEPDHPVRSATLSGRFDVQR